MIVLTSINVRMAERYLGLIWVVPLQEIVNVGFLRFVEKGLHGPLCVFCASRLAFYT